MPGEDPAGEAEERCHSEAARHWDWGIYQDLGQQSARLSLGNNFTIQKEITELKKLVEQMESKYRDPESKNRIKQLKNDAQKQIDRNRVILKDLINK